MAPARRVVKVVNSHAVGNKERDSARPSLRVDVLGVYVLFAERTMMYNPLYNQAWEIEHA